MIKLTETVIIKKVVCDKCGSIVSPLIYQHYRCIYCLKDFCGKCLEKGFLIEQQNGIDLYGNPKINIIGVICEDCINNVEGTKEKIELIKKNKIRIDQINREHFKIIKELYDIMKEFMVK